MLLVILERAAQHHSLEVQQKRATETHAIASRDNPCR